MKALLSVFDKTGIVGFGRALHVSGYDLVSTGGTYKALTEEGELPVQQVADLTGSPEILDGRVKTLHPKIHGGILARRDLESHTRQMAEHHIDAIDLVAVNLYPFVETISRPGVTHDDALENIDIGGPTMIRAAAKNYAHVIVVVDPADYGWITERLYHSSGADVQPISLEERKRLAHKAFQHVATYDAAVGEYLSDGDLLSGDELALGYRKLSTLRYGENPHQSASLYADVTSPGEIAASRQIHGRELSFNNILDADAAWGVVSDFSETAVAIIKHTSPCGLAVDDDQAVAYMRAFEGDPVSAYGGIVGFNRAVTASAAEAMQSVFYEVVVAPAFEPEALAILKKRKNLRVLEVGQPESVGVRLDVRKIRGGALIQAADDAEVDPASWRTMTVRIPLEHEMADLIFAWKAVKHVKSNAIVLAKDSALIGMGAGQPNRVNSVHLALRGAGEKAKGSVLASDAFLSFVDNVDLAADGGVTAIVQPGGSIRDQEVIDKADRRNVAMVFTGVRHFRH